MIILSKQLKLIIKEEIQKIINENSINNSELKSIKSLVPFILSAFKTDKYDGVARGLYDHVTRHHDSYDEVMKMYSKPEEKKKYDAYWEKVKQTMKTICQKYNWEYNDGGAWTQFTKPFQGNYQHGTGNYKRYITFKRGKEYYDNVSKIQNLLKNINDAKTLGKVSFKISSNFLPGYSHNDNIVIHYKENNDAAAIENAVKQTGFSVVDRASIGRTDTGRDIGTDSDSNIVSNKIAENIKNNKTSLMKYLSQPENSSEYMKGISALKHIIDSVMQKSSHR
jgi:hypothetical protein